MSATLEHFIENLTQSGLLSAHETTPFVDSLSQDQDAGPQQLAHALIEQGKLTPYQAESILNGQTGWLVFGEYTVLDRIGQGGMGVVFKAQHRRMRREVAIKVLPPESMNRAAAVERFYREVEAAAKLMHPNIVTALDASEHAGTHYLVMEYVAGADVAAVLKKSGRLSLSQAIDITLQAARGLDHAHRQGVVHRDIKPANLLLALDGTVKVLDMGLARINTQIGDASDETMGQQLTQTDQLMGTVDYMAPEQAEDTRSADQRADIYSLGCTLYCMLDGAAPYAGDTMMKKLLAHREAPIPSLQQARRDAPPQLESVFAKMVAKNPADRQQSMAEVISELEAIATLPAVVADSTVLPAANRGDWGTAETVDLSEMETDSDVPAQAPGLANRKSTKRRKWSAIAITVVAVTLIGVVLTVMWPNNGTRQPDNGGDSRGGDDKSADDTDSGEGDDSTSLPFALSLDGNGSVYPARIEWSGAQDFCLEAQVTPSRVDGDHWVIEFRPGISLGISEGEWLAFVSAGNVNSQVFGAGKVKPDMPVHVALVRDNLDLKLYVDGVLVDTNQLKGAEIATNDEAVVQIGRGFVGLIDEVQISSVRRYVENFSPAERLDPDVDTSLLYHFDDASDMTTAIDAAGKHNGMIDQGDKVRGDKVTR